MPPPPPQLPAVAPDEGSALADVPAGMAYGMVAAALLIGFLIGTRARQVLASAKVIGKAVRSFTIKIPPKADDGDKGDDGDDEAEMENAQAREFSVEDYLNVEQSGLDDHPDLHVNPVLMYQIKLERDRQRAEKARLERIALLGDVDGLTEEEINAKLAESEFTADAGPKTANALATLISVGARTTAVASGASAESQLIAERRRQQRNIDVYLAKALDVNVKRGAPTKRYAKGGVLKSALDVAKETGVRAYGGEGYERVKRNPYVAKAARGIWRQWEIRRRANLPDEIRMLEDRAAESDGEGDAKKEETQARRGGGVLNVAELAEFAALFAEEEDDEGEGEGEEDALPADVEA